MNLLDPPHIPTGCPVFDFTKCSGLPRGHVVHLFGGETTGKTTLALMAAAAVCREGGIVVYVDSMYGFSPDHAEFLGVPYNTGKFTLFQPESQQDGIAMASHWLLGGVDLVVFDAIGAPGMEMPLLSDTRALWAAELPLLKQVANRTGAVILGLDYEVDGHVLGGQSWKFLASRRVRLKCFKHPSIRYEIVKDKVSGQTGTMGDLDLPVMVAT